MVTIVNICDGVFLDSDESSGPEQVFHQGRVLYRFMDKFYVRGVTEGLTPIEVSELCRARASHPSNILGANDAVRRLFRDLIRSRKPTRVLEIGAGANPILTAAESENSGIQYFASDADPNMPRSQNLFSGMHAVLPHEDGYFDIAIAVFVLHFHFYRAQIEELARCLSPSGVLVANVYRRSPQSRGALQSAFEATGLAVRRLEDQSALCSRHEYWVVGKGLDVASEILNELAAICSSR